MKIDHRIVYTFIAFDDIDLLKEKIDFLYTKEDLFIIHWNRYSPKKKFKRLKEMFAEYPNVYVYSKIKVVWGTYTILLAMLENMKKALELSGERGFEHLIVLSEQCIPVKTKEYIKQHLYKYKGYSFCGSHDLFPEIESTTVSWGAPFRLTKYFYCFLGKRYGFLHKFPLTLQFLTYLNVFKDFFYYFIPIIKKIPEVYKRLRKDAYYKQQLKITCVDKIIFSTSYFIKLPLKLIFHCLFSGIFWLGNYGKPSKLLSYCRYGSFRFTKGFGPTGCYCRNDIEYLCREKNIKLAQSMGRYLGPEEYFCETLLYNDSIQRKNFLNENLCVSDPNIEVLNDTLRYTNPYRFSDILVYSVPMNFQFEHVCFLRKVSDPAIFAAVKKSLQEQSDNLEEKGKNRI